VPQIKASAAADTVTLRGSMARRIMLIAKSFFQLQKNANQDVSQKWLSAND
jgi:hypothetical protein